MEKENSLEKYKQFPISFTFSQEIRPSSIEHQESKEPAPNSYNPNIDFIKPSNPKYSIQDTKKRDNITKHTIVGPADLQPIIKKNYNIHYSMTKQIREDKQETFNRLGPAFYDPNPNKILQKVPLYSFGYRIQPNVTNSVIYNPGPGSYLELDHSKSAKLSIAFPQSSRYLQDQSVSKGPGEYEYQQKNRIQAPSHKIPKQKKFLNSDFQNSIGPGQYQIKDQSYEHPGKTIAMKLKKDIQDVTPGPGSYENQMKEHFQKITQGTTKRNQFINSPFPMVAPWSYQVEVPKNNPKQISFTKSNHSFENKFLNEQTHIPGIFNNKRTGKLFFALRNFKGQWSGKSHRFFKKMRDNQGPGKYNIYPKTLDTLGVMSKAERFKKESNQNLPGPGDYTIDSIKDTKIKIRIPQSKIYKKVTQSTPDHYDNTSYFGKIPSYMQIRKEQINSTISNINTEITFT